MRKFAALVVLCAAGFLAGCNCGCNPCQPCCPEPVYQSPCCPAPSGSITAAPVGSGQYSGGGSPGGGGVSCGGGGKSCG
jgi:uncharacterized membrane protein YgcG